MYFIAFIEIKTGELMEFYKIENENYIIASPEDVPPLDFKFKISLFSDGSGEILNFTSLNSFYFLNKLCKCQLIDYITNEYFKSDFINIWVI